MRCLCNGTSSRIRGSGWGIHFAVTSLLRNVGMLVCLQGVNYLAPLIITPYLIAVCGIEVYGDVAYCLGVYVFITVVADAGLLVRGTHQVSEATGARRRRVASAIYGARFWSGCTGSVLLVLIAMSMEGGDRRSIMLCLAPAVLAQCMQPVWYFRGIERPSDFLLIFSFGRTAFVALVLIFVKDSESPELVGLFQSCTLSFSAVLGAVIMRRRSDLGGFLDPRGAIKVLWQARGFGGANLGYAFLSSAGLMVLGNLAPSAVVGAYSLVDQLSKAARGLRDAVADAVLPWAARTARGDVVTIFAIVAAMVFAALAASVPWLGSALIEIFGSGQVSGGEPTLMLFILALALVPDSLSAFLGYPWFAARGAIERVNRCVILTALLYGALLSGAAWMWPGSGAATTSMYLVAVVSLAFALLFSRSRLENTSRLKCPR
ncbi:oligosaccharide flippase family protein [Nocardioides abyssi]|uniref:Oligosaccharide flippase family protein n=1 Tax=Nocardioides abyssi TaxID=3058370 RepID=A0ABT8EZ58_9ACTN|nr:oligosaccharide flippase family protein [Nocardioides abyssi]MDN4163299.1 oligosaccharide flippase family protein [Nocardioides abyssi]